MRFVRVVQVPVLVVAVLAAGCSSPAERASSPPASSDASAAALEQARTVRVVFEGNHEVAERDLAAAMQVTRAETPPAKRREALEHDVLWLYAIYFDRGFVTIDIAKPAIERQGDTALVRLSIAEGARFRVRAFRVRDDDSGPPIAGDLRARFRTREGDTFSRGVIVEDLEAVRRLYRDAGYADVEAEPTTTLDKAHAEIDIDLEVRRRDLVTIDRVVVVGNRRVSTERILAELDIAPGSRFSQSKIEQAKRRVEALDTIKRVDVSTHPTQKARTALTFEVREAP